jgi:hypothetical protein
MTNDLSNTRTLVGVFADANSAAQAINDLKVAGFTPDSISVISKDRREVIENTDLDGDDNRAAEGTLAGSLGGGTLGAVLGWLLAGGTALIPGIGPIVAAGVFGATLTGALVGGALGGLSGALAGVGVPEEEASEYETHFREGRTVVAVTAANGYQLESARDVFDRNNATLTRHYEGSQHDVATRTVINDTDVATASTTTTDSTPLATSTYRDDRTMGDISTLPTNPGTGTVPRPRTDLDDVTLPSTAVPKDSRDDLPPPSVVI